MYLLNFEMEKKYYSVFNLRNEISQGMANTGFYWRLDNRQDQGEDGGVGWAGLGDGHSTGGITCVLDKIF